MPQAVWVGELSFGLVNIPVKLFTATSPKRVRFHQYEAGTGRRIRYRRVAEGPEDVRPPPQEPEPGVDENEPTEAEFSGPQTAEAQAPHALPFTQEGESRDSSPETEEEPEVPWEGIVKGYEVEPGRVVTVEREELESVAPQPSRTIEVELFTQLHDIDPVHFEKSYYVVPQRGPVAGRPYWLLYRAMEETGRVAVGRFVLRTKEYLAVVRPAEHVLMLETLFYSDEVRDPKEVLYPSFEEPSEREMQVAHQFLDALTGDWDPSRHRDEHRERLLEFLHSKTADALEVPEPGEEEVPTSAAIDLMDALRASVEAAREAKKNQERQTG
jgi:DNA end-binding protein Ku